jgi:hypothetical protein
MNKLAAKSKPVKTLPIHFKTPGRSYSQIGRKGNVALYQVFSDYLIVPDFVLPYLTIGFELIAIKNKLNGDERYPRPEEFGHCAWSIPKSFSPPCSISLGMRGVGRNQRGSSTSKILPNRSPTSEGSPGPPLETTQGSGQSQKTDQTPAEAPPERHRRVTLLGKNQILNLSEWGGGGSPTRGAGIERPVPRPGKIFRIKQV